VIVWSASPSESRKLLQDSTLVGGIVLSQYPDQIVLLMGGHLIIEDEEDDQYHQREQRWDGEEES
jgi:hypothetical protein